jgi:hypothetical protein
MRALGGRGLREPIPDPVRCEVLAYVDEARRAGESWWTIAATVVLSKSTLLTTRSLRVFPYAAPADLRKGFDGAGAGRAGARPRSALRRLLPVRQPLAHAREGSPLGRHRALHRILASRSTQAARDLLGDYTGVVLCDGYAAYHALAKGPPPVREAR